ncbi:MAG: tetratricopeptide (TPR) repeat protein [Lentimonas sp.]|jgi:tetratricopeptide (TPR) repeat protein
MKLIAFYFSILCIAHLGSAANSFSLSDTSPQSPEFHARFIGSYGINSAIEPTITQEDRPLYESIAPHLQSNPQQAIQLAMQGINSNSNAAFDFLVGSLYYSHSKYSQARRHLKQAIQKFPNFRRAHRNLALIYIQQENYTSALPHLLKVIKLGGGDGQSYSLLGYSYLNLEKYQSALSAYHMARMFMPDSADIRRGEAHFLLMTNQNNAAIALFDELLAQFPSTQDYWLLQANAFLAEERFADAIANLEIAHTVATPSADTHKLLADLYMNQQVNEQALVHYQAALQANPKMDPGNAFKPLNYLMQLNLFEAAAVYLETLNTTLRGELSPRQASEKAVLSAQLELEIGDAAQGLQQLEAVLTTDPLNADALLMLANYNLQEENYAEAEFYFERATVIADAQVDALIGLARTAVMQGKFKNALTHLQRSQKLKPRNDVAQFIASIQQVVSAQ